MDKEKFERNSLQNVLTIIIPIIIAIFMCYWGMTNNVNQRIDILNSEISKLNREMGEIRTEITCCFDTLKLDLMLLKQA